MWRFCLLACVLGFGLGCSADGSWDEAWKDLRGDNMRMMADREKDAKNADRPSRARSDD
jgi:hypothetical protein